MTDVETMSVEDLNLSVRAYNGLYRANIKTVGELIRLTPRQLLQIKNVGKTTVGDIEAALAEIGLSLSRTSS